MLIDTFFGNFFEFLVMPSCKNFVNPNRCVYLRFQDQNKKVTRKMSLD